MLCTFNTQCLLVACQSVRHGTLAQEMHNHLVHWLASSATTPAELVLLLSRPTLVLQFTEHSARVVTNSKGMALCRLSTRREAC